MATTTANIIVNAKNQTGGAFKGLQTSLGSVGKWFQNSKLDIALTAGQMLLFSGAASEGAEEVGKVEEAAQRAANRTAIAFGVMTGAIDLAKTALGQLKDAFGDALERQTQNLNSVITATKTLGLTQSQAADYVEGFNKQVARLGKDLPTSAENITTISRTIMDDYAIALKGAGASTNQVRELLIGSSTRAALLTELGGGNVADTQSALTAYLSGSVGTQGLDQYSFFANNPLLRTKMIDLAGKAGKDLTDMSGIERVKLIIEALDGAVSPEDVEKLKGLSKSKISGFMDALFNPEEGIFSIQKDIEPNLPGYQSVFTSLERTLDLVIGENGILAAIGKLSGIEGSSPMKLLKQAVDLFNDFLEGIVTNLQGLPQLNMNFLNNLDLNNLSANIDPGAIGKSLAGAVNFVFDMIFRVLGSIDYGALIGAFFVALGSFLVNLDWRVYAVAGAAMIMSVLVPILSFVMVVLVQVLFGQLLASMFGAIGGLVVSMLLPVIMPFILAIGGVIVVLIVGIIVGIIALGKMVYDNWDSITKAVGDFFNWIEKGADKLIDKITNSGFYKSIENFFVSTTKSADDFLDRAIKRSQGFFNSVVDFFNNLEDNINKGADAVGNFFIKMFDAIIQGLQDTWNKITGKISEVTNGIGTFFQNPWDTTVSAVQSAASNPLGVVQGALNTAGNILNPVGTVAGQILDAVTPNYAGNLGVINAANGLFDAIRAETINMPVGAGLAIANTSETILTTEQLTNLVEGSYNTGARSYGGNNATINIQSGAITLVLPQSTPQAIAMEALRILEERLTNELEDRLAF